MARPIFKMDKTAIKSYAVWAREKLIDGVATRAAIYGVTAKKISAAPEDEIVEGRVLSDRELAMRCALIRDVKEKGFDQIVEETAYRWFNRFSALRFMEVNGRLPSRVRVFTNDRGDFRPQILAEAFRLELPGLDRDLVYAFENKGEREELYRYLLATQCNALGDVLPCIFEKVDDYAELLLPNNLLSKGGILDRLVTEIPAEDWDWTNQVEIIGWLYQYYNSELKAEVFANLRKNIKISKEMIPAATQLFTPDWIVRYMVENSLGRLWLEGHPNDELKAKWKYYLDEPEQTPEVQAQFDEIRKEYATIEPEDIRVIDPCMGSGHILCVFFDVLMQLYAERGYATEDAVAKIVEKNIWGLDIDARASQLACFAVMMKALKYDRHFLDRKIRPHLYEIHESNVPENAPEDIYEHFQNSERFKRLSKENQETLDYLNGVFLDAKEKGALIQLEDRDYEELKNAWESAPTQTTEFWSEFFERNVTRLINQAILLSQKYHVVVTNPPHMSARSRNKELSEFVKKSYPVSKNNLFACFMERAHSFVKNNCILSMITMDNWMFISSYKKLRQKINAKNTIVNMTHMPYSTKLDVGLGINLATTAFVMRKGCIRDYAGQYQCLSDSDYEDGTPISFPTKNKRWKAVTQERFSKIPGEPMAYWAEGALLRSFDNPPIGKTCVSRTGFVTGNNDLFVRFWFEVAVENVVFGLDRSAAKESGRKWFPYNKGGKYRKWYGNRVCVVDWFDDRKEMRTYRAPDGRPIRSHSYNLEYIFKKHLTWTTVRLSELSFRMMDDGFLFDATGNAVFVPEDQFLFVLAYLNTKVVNRLSNIINPAQHFPIGDFDKLPYVVARMSEVEPLSADCIALSRADWDSSEISWDFQRHPLTVGNEPLLAARYERWKGECESRFQRLKANEEELNRIFIDIYKLQDEMTPDVADKDVSVRRIFDTKEDVPESMQGSAYIRLLRNEVASLISYSVGCIFGRYSLDEPGLAYAGGEWDPGKYRSFKADRDNVVPIGDEEYFENDIVPRFVEFIEVVYGKETLEENLEFVANALGGQGSAREIIRRYFLKDFYRDHLRTYRKRPIYWLFDSGKKDGFKALVYIHRYAPDLLARIRSDYVHSQQRRYLAAISHLEALEAKATGAERVRLGKRLAALRDQATEIKSFEEKVHHLADQMIGVNLDDGVKHNYAIFEDVVAKLR